MKYAVISPKNKLICFDDPQQVASYCMKKDNQYLDAYCQDQELEYENMSPVEIGYFYSLVGAQDRGCRIYPTADVIKAMKEEGVDKEMIEEVQDFFNARGRYQEVECPGYLEDIFIELTPIYAAELSGGVYSCENIDGASHERGNPGV